MKSINHIVDPAFLRTSNYSYVDYDKEDLTSVLCFALSKNPNDLILHQQRIEWFAKNNQPSLLFSALVDLFTSLQSKGYDYKMRMLEKYQGLLSTEQFDCLKHSLNSNIDVNDVINNLDESLLNSGLQGILLSSQQKD
jgi:hypothetical protein